MNEIVETHRTFLYQVFCNYQSFVDSSFESNDIQVLIDEENISDLHFFEDEEDANMSHHLDVESKIASMLVFREASNVQPA